jgi:hypothetical protein
MTPEKILAGVYLGLATVCVPVYYLSTRTLNQADESSIIHVTSRKNTVVGASCELSDCVDTNNNLSFVNTDYSSAQLSE